MDKYFELLNRSFDFLIRVEQVYVERFLCLGVMGFAVCQMLFDAGQAFLLGLPLRLHFGRAAFPWEQTDKVAALKDILG